MPLTGVVTRAGVVYEAPPLLWRFGLRGRRRLRAVARVAIDATSPEKLKQKVKKNEQQKGGGEVCASSRRAVP